MKVPDKIYVLTDDSIGFLSHTFTNIPHEYGGTKQDIEYICKDVLLEWVKGEIMPGNSAEGRGWNLALQSLIEKLTH